MREQFIRTEMLLGAEALERLQNARVALFGLGGVGGYTLEALTRSGVGQLDLIDNDTVSWSNLNRQILATYDTVGMRKVDAAKQRVLSINPACVVRTYAVFYTPETAGQFDFTQYDYIVDAIDTVTGKLVAQCTAQGKTLEELTLEELQAVSPLFEQDVYDALNLENCMALRSSYGGPAVSETARQIGEIEQFIQERS